MRKALLAAGTAVVTIAALTACAKPTDTKHAVSPTPSPRAPYAGVILPDTTSLARWETLDRPQLEKAFKAANVRFEIANAQGDPHQFQTIADQMIADGVNVLMIVSLDTATGTAVLTKAKAAGIITVDYDRLTPGGGADYYLAFDHAAAGKLAGDGIVTCLNAAPAGHPTTATTRPAIAELDGPTNDNTAALLASGITAALAPSYASHALTKGPTAAVPGWDATNAATAFEGMLSTPNLGAVIASSDELADAAITVLKTHHRQLPVAGVGATVSGLQHILAGDQCLTVNEDVRQQATAAASLAATLISGGRPAISQAITDPTTNRSVPAILLTPTLIVKDTVKTVVANGYVSRSDLCTSDFAAPCAAAGIH